MKKPTGNRQQRATLADVGKAAQVSPMTVSKVLRKTGRISEATQKRVLQAVAKLGYVPNQLAGSLGAATSNIVGVLIPSADDTVNSKILSSINKKLNQYGMRTFVGESNFEPDIEYEQVRSFLSIRPAGLILSGGVRRHAKTDDLLEKHGIATVQIWDGDMQTGTANIGPSHEDIGRAMATHFLDLGLKNVAYVGSELSHDLCAARRAGSFERTLQDHDVTCTFVTSENVPRQSGGGAALTERMLDEHKGIGGVHYLNDAMALGGLRVMYQRGFLVPDQIQVTGFNGTSLETSVRTRLTTINMSYAKLGTAAAEAVIALADGRDVQSLMIQDTQFVYGNTTGKPVLAV